MNSKKDGEKLAWIIAEIIFIGLYIFVSGWYSSYSKMTTSLQALVWVGRVGMVACILISWIKFKNPNFDIYRKVTVGIAIVLSLIIGIHHSVSREDTQVIIDSHENAQKQ